MVRYDALEAYGNPILADDHDGRVAKFREMTDLAKVNGSLVVAQISHPGRQGAKHLNPEPVSASDVHLQIRHAGNEFAKPRALSVVEIKEMVKLWGQTAYLCHNAGFHGVQVHCAHGYLLAQFLSPTTNLRTDEYGGDLGGRSRIVFEIINEIRHRVPDPSFMICVKLNSVEFQHRGTTGQEAITFCQELEKARVDFIDLSGGTFERQLFHHVKDSTKQREAYFIEFAEMIRPLLKKTKVYVTGGLRSAGGMVKAIQDGCDGIGIGRPLGNEPFLCRKILNGAETGAIENFMPLAYSTQSTGTQLHQLAKGHELISDYSVDTEVQRWMEANEEEQARKAKLLPKVDSCGYPDIMAEAGFAYLNFP